MCLYLNLNSRLTTAKKDLTVYKIVIDRNGAFSTLFRNCFVNIGKIYRSRIEFDVNEINIALHSFKSLTEARKYKDMYSRVQGYSSDLKLIKCIIPAGSKYVEGHFNNYKSYASNKIKYVEIIPPLIRKLKKG